jgi:hypothetical protein
MFTVKGRIRGKPYSITWDDGKLTGDGLAVDMTKIQAAAKEGRPVGPVGQYTETDHLKDPVSALYLITSDVFTSVIAITGEIPEADGAPEGAVI